MRENYSLFPDRTYRQATFTIKSSSGSYGVVKVKKQLSVVIVILLCLTLVDSIHGSTNDGEGEKWEKGELVAGEKAVTDAKPASGPASLTTEEQLILLNEKVRKLEEIVDRQQRIIEAMEPKTEVKTSETVAVSGADPVAPSTQAAVATADGQDSILSVFSFFDFLGTQTMVATTVSPSAIQSTKTSFYSLLACSPNASTHSRETRTVFRSASS
jgi:hypothetical protein